MRISDWSSDVCSSDLTAPAPSNSICPPTEIRPSSGRSRPATMLSRLDLPEPDGPINAVRPGPAAMANASATLQAADLPQWRTPDRLPRHWDRKSAVWGKSVSEHVDVGGGGGLKKKTKKVHT